MKKIFFIILTSFISMNLYAQERKILLEKPDVKIFIEHNPSGFENIKLNTPFKIKNLYYANMGGVLDTFAYFSFPPINDKVFFDGTYLSFLIDSYGTHILCIFKLKNKKFYEHVSFPITAEPNKIVEVTTNHTDIFMLDYAEIIEGKIHNKFLYEILPDEKSYLKYDTKEGNNNKVLLRKSKYYIPMQIDNEEAEYTEKIHQKYIELKSKGELDNYLKKLKDKN